MIPASFEYHRAASVDDAIEALGRDEDAKLLAGGHSLVPAMKLRIARPSVLVDLGRLDELRYVRDDGDRIAIGALTRHAQLVSDPVLEGACAVLARTAELVGDPQVRHRGTIGGSVAHGDPASDLPAVLLALDADFVAHGPDGERTVPASSFFTGPFETALGPRATKSASRARSTAGRSDAGSACATEPPIVPRWRTCGSPTSSAVRDTTAQAPSRTGSATSCACRVSAPIAMRSPSSRT